MRCSAHARARFDAIGGRGLVGLARAQFVPRLRLLRAAQPAGEQRQRRLQRDAPGFVVGRAGHGQRTRAAAARCTSSRSKPARGPADSTLRDAEVNARCRASTTAPACAISGAFSSAVCTAYSMNTAHFAGESRNACVRGLDTSESGSSMPDSTVRERLIRRPMQDAQHLGLRLPALRFRGQQVLLVAARAAPPSADSPSGPRDPLPRARARSRGSCACSRRCAGAPLPPTWRAAG